jgi:hypothetical protein
MERSGAGGRIRQAVLAVCLVMALPGMAVAVHLEGALDFGTGGGYDDNLNHASSRSQQSGSGFATSWLRLNASKNIFETGRYFLSAGYEGIYYPSVNDLTVNSFAIRGGISYPVSKTFFVNGAVSWGDHTYGDSDRDATVYDFLVGIKDQVAQRFAVRADYRYTSNAAEQSVFSYDANRFRVSGEMSASKTAYLVLGYALELTQRTFYQSATAPTPPGAEGRTPSSTFGPNQVVLKSDAVVHVFSVDWDQDLYDGIYWIVGYAYSYAQMDPENYQDHFISGKVGYRF